MTTTAEYYKKIIEKDTDQTLLEELKSKDAILLIPEALEILYKEIEARVDNRLENAFAESGVIKLYEHAFLDKDHLWYLFQKAMGIDVDNSKDNKKNTITNIQNIDNKSNDEYCECGGKLAWKSCMLICSNCLKCHAG